MSHKYPLSTITRVLLNSFTWRTSLPVFAIAAGLACPSITQAQEFNLNIPSQSLDGALRAFGDQAKMQIQYNAEIVKGVNTKGVQGRLTPSAALTVLLKDTGLSHQINGNTVAITNNSANSNQTQSTKQLGTVTVTAQAVSPTVTEGNNSYTTKAVSIGKGEHSLKEIPQSVTVITRQRMDEQNLNTVDDVLLQTTGITRENSNYGNLRYSARGFVIDNYQFDGIPVDDYGGISSPDMATFDRVEVLRGATGLLNGNGQPAGTVNFVRKRPLAEKQLTVDATVGSWHYYRTEIDGTGPLNASGTIRGRVVTSFEDKDYFYNTSHSTKPMIYGIFEADLGEKTTLMFGGRHQTDDISGRWVRGLPRYADGSSLDLPRSTSLGVDWARYKNTTTEIFGELEHRFNQDWKGKITARRLEGDRFDKTASWFGTVDPVTLTGLSWGSVDYETFKSDQNILDTNIVGKFKAFGRTHELLLGANWQEIKSDTNSASLAQAIFRTLYY